MRITTSVSSVVGPDLSRRLDAVHLRHLHVHEHDVRPFVLRARQRPPRRRRPPRPPPRCRRPSRGAPRTRSARAPGRRRQATADPQSSRREAAPRHGSHRRGQVPPPTSRRRPATRSRIPTSPCPPGARSTPEPPVHTATVVDDLEAERLPGLELPTPTLAAGTTGVLQHVRQRFLHDAVRGEIDTARLYPSRSTCAPSYDTLYRHARAVELDVRKPVEARRLPRQAAW